MKSGIILLVLFIGIFLYFELDLKKMFVGAVLIPGVPPL